MMTHKLDGQAPAEPFSTTNQLSSPNPPSFLHSFLSKEVNFNGRKYGIDNESDAIVEETNNGITIKSKNAEGIRHPQHRFRSSHSLQFEDEAYGSYT